MLESFLFQSPWRGDIIYFYLNDSKPQGTCWPFTIIDFKRGHFLLRISITSLHQPILPGLSQSISEQYFICGIKFPERREFIRY